MNILVVHNRYAFHGGEDEAFASEVDLLTRHGHSVFTHVQHNSAIDDRARGWAIALRTLWSREDYQSVREILRKHQISIVSVHNFFPLISPSVYYAARDEAIPVVQTLHNYRLLCPAATFSRDGSVCEDCFGKQIAWPGIRHGCYRGSRLQTGLVAAMTATHRQMGTWDRVVTCYIALTPFMRNKFVDAGFPPDRMFVKPNSVEDTGLGEGESGDFLFVGRLTAVKGLDVLLKAWKLAGTRRRLKIIGTGPDELSLRASAQGLSSVQFLGELPPAKTREQIGRAAAVIFPSIWYEGLSRVLIEAFSKGTPVIASDVGPLPSIVSEGSGVLFRVGDANELARKMSEFPHSGRMLSAMRAAARRQYEEKYSDGVVYNRLMLIYDHATRLARMAQVPATSVRP